MTYGTENNRYGGLTLVPTSDRFLPLAKEVKDYLEIFNEERRVVKFPTQTDLARPVYDYRASGEPFVRQTNEHICDHDVYILTSGPGTPEMLMELFMTEMYMVGRHASRITLVCGYLPLSRSDKDEKETELAVLPHIIHLIKSAAYDDLHRIISCDLHAPQNVMAAGKPALITEVSMARLVLTKVINDALEKFRPDKIAFSLLDEGSAKRFAWAVKSVSEEFGIPFPVIIGKKIRKDSETTKIEGLTGDLDRLPGSLVIGIDDEVATAFTQIQIATEFIRTLGVSEFWGMAVHGIFCKNAVENLMAPGCPISRIYTTDTVPFCDRQERMAPLFESNRPHVVPFAPEVAQIISHHHWGHSIRTFR
ncbi:MAG: ribose-phosphate pyrophosphokinase-like domain-containing protein [Patescibacteria group bacterium]|nr:ribose-phosphate pyrophosphokinase-like domain-containing protein [Patescibacteria group bacterium]